MAWVTPARPRPPRSWLFAAGLVQRGAHPRRAVRGSWHRARLGVPDLGRVLVDGAIAGELARPGDVEDGLACRPLLLRVELEEPPVRLQLGGQVGLPHIMVGAGELPLAQGPAAAGHAP